MKPLILLIMGLVVIGSLASLILIYNVPKPREEWSLVVTPKK